MVANIEASLRAQGYDLLFTTTDDPSMLELRKNIARLEGQLVDGLALVAPVEGIHLDALAAAIDIPYVLIDVPLGRRLPSVVIDQRHGSRLATEHLIELGHRTICEISGPLGWCGADLRDEGWRRALEAAGLPPGRLAEGDWSAASGYAAAERLLAEDPGFTALVVGNDQMALGAVAALRAAGLSVPGDVSVVGFDDIPEAAYFVPPLTTVRQDFTALGRQSAEYLVERMGSSGAPAQQRVLYPELVLRESAAPPRG
jgi:LacI family transcriptional regulator